MNDPKRIESMKGAELRWLPFGKLEIHPKIQRKFQEARARRLLAEFDGARLTPLMVSEEGTRFLVYEGQHRAWAIAHYLGDAANGELVLCYVRKNVPHSELAKDRLATDAQMKMRPTDRFLMRVYAEDSEALAIRGVLGKYGLTMAESASPGAVRCVGACQRIVSRPGGVKMLDRVMGMLFHAFGKGSEGYHRDLVSALGLLVFKFGAVLDDTALVRVLGQGQEDAPGWVAAGNQVAAATGGDVGRGVITCVLRSYNKGRKQKLSFDD